MPQLQSPTGSLESLKYSELQKLAKIAGIRANQKSEKLVKELQLHYKNANNDGVCKKTRESNNSGQQTEGSANKSVQDITKITLEPRQDSRKRRRTFELKESSLSPALTPTTGVHGGKRSSGSNACDNIGNRPAQREACKRTFEKSDSGTKGSGQVSKKRRRTFELEEPTLSPALTPTTDGGSKRSSRSKSRAQNSDSANEGRRGTFDQKSAITSSPGTKSMIKNMDASASATEMKASLMSALDKKVQEKVGDIQAKSNSTNQPSHIPRFMAFLAKMKETQAQKPRTPGSKDWTKIHNKAFSKFDPIDVYLEKKQQRMEKLTNSGKKGIPSSPFRKGPTIAKPVTKPTGQQGKSFVPTVTSTKNLNFNFGKTPSISVAKTPARTADKKEATKTPKPLPASSAKKPVSSVKRENPFIFTGSKNSLNTTFNKSSLNNTTFTSQKKNFDLKASLAKPLTWKPHTGKLQPLDINKSGISVVAKPLSSARGSRQAMASKSKPTSVKDVNRAKQLARRNNQKYVDMMKKRGLM